MAYKAVIAGTSGLIGSKLLDHLLHHSEYSEITILVRRKSKYNSKKLNTIIVDFDNLDNYADEINGHALFCCLGSTREKTPDLGDYRKIDHDYPLKLAEIAKKNGMEQYHLVSSIGANAASSNFYTKMKGETEEDIKRVGMPGLYIYQPSILIGKRREKRLAEKAAVWIMNLVSPLLLGGWKKYRPIAALTVAKAMFRKSLKNETGVFTYTSDKIKQIF